MADFKDQMGMLWRTAVDQLDGVKDVVEKTAKQGKAQFDMTMLRRKKKDALSQLGQATAQAIRSGRLSMEDFPEFESLMGDLEDLEDQIANHEDNQFT